MTVHIIGVLICLGLHGGIGCAIMRSKNRSGVGGFALGALLGLIGIIITLCLSKVEDDVPQQIYDVR
jgi:hypothetical protein